MNLKRLSITMLIITIVICLALVFNYLTTVNINNQKELKQYIEKINKVNNITIVKQCDSRELHAVLYKSNEELKLFILENTLLPNRYKFFGSDSTKEYFSSYNFQDSQGVLIIVYGDNTIVRASKYSMENGVITYTENINNSDYILRIFRLPDSYDINSNLYIYDTNNNQIRQY